MAEQLIVGAGLSGLVAALGAPQIKPCASLTGYFWGREFDVPIARSNLCCVERGPRKTLSASAVVGEKALGGAFRAVPGYLHVNKTGSG